MADNTISPVVPNVSGGRTVSTGQKAVTQTSAQSGIDFKSYLGGQTAVQDNSTTFLKRRNSYTLNKNKTKEISIKTASKNSPTESEVKKITDDISSQIVEKVTDDLDISEDELNNAMQLLGLTAMDLLNPANLSALYCEVTGNASFIFAIAVLMVTISLCIFYPDSVNASQSPSPSGDISTNDVTNDLDDVKSLDSGDKDLADATSDSTNGLNIYYNNESGSLSTPVRMFLVLTVLSLAPSILIMLTSFTRIIIVLHFVRTAIGTQTAPPNQVLVGLALFLTLFIMWPTFSQVNEKAIKPLDEGKITQQEAIKEAEGPFREFMYGQTQTKDIKLFVDISGDEYDDYDDVPFTTLVPAFILSELRTAFILGFLIYIPFIVIDMVVSSVLMSMGMMMLPPTTISMPFKVLLFILADGWDLVIGNLVKTFY